MKKTNPTKESPNSKKKKKRGELDSKFEYAFKVGVISEAKVQEIYERMLIWMQDMGDATSVSEFYNKEMLTTSVYYNLLKKYPYLKEAHEEAKRRIGHRLHKEAIYGRAQWTPIHFNIHDYCEEFAAAKKYNADLKKGEDETPKTINIMIPSYGQRDNNKSE